MVIFAVADRLCDIGSYPCWSNFIDSLFGSKTE